MREGSLVTFDHSHNRYVRHQQMSTDGSAFRLWSEMNNHLRAGQYFWVPVTEVGVVIKKVTFDSLPSDRVRVLFPSGIGWVDARDLVEVQET